MTESLLIDTDVLIDFLRGHSRASGFLKDLKVPLYISSISVAELYAGVRGSKEELVLERFVNAFTIVEVTKVIAVLGGFYRNKYGKSHGNGLADSLIAASANTQKITLVTLNKKHFPMVDSIFTPYIK